MIYLLHLLEIVLNVSSSIQDVHWYRTQFVTMGVALAVEIQGTKTFMKILAWLKVCVCVCLFEVLMDTILLLDAEQKMHFKKPLLKIAVLSCFGCRDEELMGLEHHNAEQKPGQ